MEPVAATGQEHAAEFSENQGIGQGGGTESGTPAAKTPPVDPELADVIRAWPALLESVRAGITAMIKATLHADNG